MHIQLSNIGKKYNREWIFKALNARFDTGKSYAILGSNGSGKSTLLKIISGYVIPSEGEITYSDKQVIPQENIFKYVSAAAPYIELYEELSFTEAVEFQNKFSPFLFSVESILDKTELPLQKQIRNFSSGMKQKAKLALAIFSSAPILLLDEPTINLDSRAKNWYSDQMEVLRKDKLIVVCSNFEELEYHFTDEKIEVENFKALRQAKA